jgi:hypothetical protein
MAHSRIWMDESNERLRVNTTMQRMQKKDFIAKMLPS